VRKQQEAEVARSAEQQRQLDYERQSQLQKEEVNKQIEDQRLFDEWKAQRGGGAQTAAIPATTSSEDVVTAQRLLTALGYYRGPVDGMSGGQTRSAVMQFEQAQGLPQTGVATPALISRMRSVL
jgi:peptidoglycan hydrolase-like protein with peptidoglycan-binding domain